jgi:predicted RNA-binding Zn-ribbon protein involved in translation (DUF1610 family)
MYLEGRAFKVNQLFFQSYLRNLMDQNTSPHCPHCTSENTKKDGKTKAGTQRYRCKACGKTFTEKKRGRPTIGDQPRTPAENQKARYDRMSAEERAAYNKRRRPKQK